MNNKFLLNARLRFSFLIFTFLGIAWGLSTADEIFLKEGKILQGKITKEDDAEYTILLGRNMVLRVPKTAVADIKRKVVKEGPRVIRMTPTTAGVSASSATVKTVSLKTEILNIRADIRENRKEKHGIVINELIIYKPYAVLGDEFSDIKNFISDAETGRGILVGRKREPSRTFWEPTWEGIVDNDEGKQKWKSGVVRASITVTVPYWKTPESPSVQTINEWNRFISNINSLEMGRIQLYSAGLESLAESLRHLRSSSENDLRNESERLLEEMKQKTEKRQQGYLRRVSERSDAVKKP